MAAIVNRFRGRFYRLSVLDCPRHTYRLSVFFVEGQCVLRNSLTTYKARSLIP